MWVAVTARARNHAHKCKSKWPKRKQQEVTGACMIGKQHNVPVWWNQHAVISCHSLQHAWSLKEFLKWKMTHASQHDQKSTPSSCVMKPMTWTIIACHSLQHGCIFWWKWHVPAWSQINTVLCDETKNTNCHCPQHFVTCLAIQNIFQWRKVMRFSCCKSKSFLGNNALFLG